MVGLEQRRVLVGVSAGIAAYKTPDLVRRLREAGAEVRVVMTAGAMEFVKPLTFQAVSGQPVRTTLLDPDAEAGMGHIELARWAEAILIAPASADVLARLAHGLADDLLTTLCLATDAPLMVAPAMNRLMWAHPATRANCGLLAERGVLIVGPDEGDQACGESGAGRMLEPLALVQRLGGLFAEPVLSGLRLLVTAGPTREAVDPVRYISNRSSGKMGFAIASAARAAGADVTLVAGPVNLETPTGVDRVDVETAAEMHAAVMSRADTSDIFIACAAVADYRVASVPDQKIKKSAERLSLELERNPDILGDVASLTRAPFTVGFAAETENLEAHAEDKLQRKGLDMIIANLVGRPGTGFDADDNLLWVRWPTGSRSLGPAAKTVLAGALAALIAERYHERFSGGDS